MSLESPTLIERATDVVRLSKYPKLYTAIGIGIVLLVILGAVLFGMDRCSSWRFKRGLSKDKAAIVETANQIANIKGQIGNLEQQKAEQEGKLERDKETLANSIFGREDAKKEVNNALANFNAALKANSNGATAEQIEEALRKLEDQ